MLNIICRYLIATGIVLTIAGVLGVASGLTGLLNLDRFAFGLSAGIRIVGSVAIAGCLLCALGYGDLENVDHSH